MLLALEISFEGRDKKTLAEPSGTAQEIDTISMSQPINQLCLVHIHAIVVAQLLKILNPDGITSVTCFHNPLLMNVQMPIYKIIQYAKRTERK